MNNQEVEQQHMKFVKGMNDYAKEEGCEMPEMLNHKFVALGYLEFGVEFEKGIVSRNFLNKLRILWNEGCATGSLGHHECEFCIDEGNYENRGLSSSEKELVDKKNKVRYKFPEMIFHYIEVHKFKPSDEFIQFVLERKNE